MARIPLVDLKAQYRANETELHAALTRCLDATSFIGGPDHQAFAEEFAEFCGGGHTALCGSGTDALWLAIVQLLGPGSGREEIITVSHTFFATSEAISLAGYRPVFVDVDPKTALMDVSAVEQAITPHTRAILPVHLYGQMVPMDELMALAGARDLFVIEDAAQAHGATWMGKGPGQWGHAACFSFYPGKNLGAWGDAGAVFSRNKSVIEKIRMRANHGRMSKYAHEFEGINSRMDGLQAAILRVKLRHLSDWTAARRGAAQRYDDLFAHIPVITPIARDDRGEHVYHLYVVEIPDRNAVLTKLNDADIGAGVHYPIPLHRQPAYSHLEIEDDGLPVTDRLAGRILSLPLFPEISEDQVDYVAKILVGAVTALAA